MNLTVCSYFTSRKRSKDHPAWSPRIHELEPLLNSIDNVIVFHDCFDTNDPRFIRVDYDYNYVPTVYRWLVYDKYLRNMDFDKVFIVDSTDVINLKNPFDDMKDNRLYVGYEPQIIEWGWLQRKAKKFPKIKDYLNVLHRNRHRYVLNAGLVGAGRETALAFLDKISSCHQANSQHKKKSTCMPIFNYVALKNFYPVTGKKVCTRFGEDEVNDISWWKHR